MCTYLKRNMTIEPPDSGSPSEHSDAATHAFRSLDPITLLDAIDATGLSTDGRISALNSYENRVYQIGLTDGESVIAKFYRPHRWSDASIGEEHSFCQRLVEANVPVVAPLPNTEGSTLHTTGLYRFCVYPKVSGRAPELDDPRHLAAIGRTIACLHQVGEQVVFEHRPEIDVERLGYDASDYLLASEHLPDDLYDAYEDISSELIERVEDVINSCDVAWLSLHGDMHPGNLLWGQDAPWILDLDDAASGPAIQDLWMFLSGDRAYASARLDDLLEGYETFRTFDRRELALIEPLRALRLISYAAWIARRWEDPAFPRAFPFFDTERFWSEHILSLKEQCAALDEPPLH